MAWGLTHMICGSFRVKVESVWSTLTAHTTHGNNNRSSVREVFFDAQDCNEGVDGFSPFKTLSIQPMTNFTENLARYPRLRALTLYVRTPCFKRLAQSANDAFSHVSFDKLELLYLESREYTSFQSLNNMLASSVHLKDLDDVLSRPQFRRLQHVELYFKLKVHGPAQFDPMTGLSIVSHPDSEPFDFKSYAEKCLQRKFREELPKINSRGILEIKLDICVPWCRVRITNFTRLQLDLTHNFDYRNV